MSGYLKDFLLSALWRVPDPRQNMSPFNYGTGHDHNANRAFGEASEAGFQTRNLTDAYGTQKRYVTLEGQQIGKMKSGDLRITRAPIYLPPEEVEPEIVVQVPEYAAGLVVHPSYDTIEQPDGSTKNIIRGFVSTEQSLVRIPQNIVEERQCVPLDDLFATQADSFAMAVNGTQFTQHKRIKPGQYTGYMRQLVQLLLGVGDMLRPVYEARMIEENIIERLQYTQEELYEYFGEPIPANFETMSDEAVAALNVKFPETGLYEDVKYDYRFYKTHGVTKGADGKCYIIQLSMYGVHAMPLHVHPMSQEEKFKERVLFLFPELSHQDLSGESLYDFFGGFPLNVPFPLGPELEKYVAAGEIAELVSGSDTKNAEYYAKNHYSEMVGWAFAERQNIAVNCCWNTKDNIHQGYLYFVNWSIDEALPEPDWTKQTLKVVSLFSDNTDAYYKRKARRLSEEQAQAVLDFDRSDAEAFKEFYESLEVEPLIKGNATITESQKGPLYSPRWYQGKGNACANDVGHPQIKFPDEQLGFNHSFNFEDTWYPGDPELKVPARCDTPMWACWIKDQLMVVNYFWEPTKDKPQTERDSRGFCQYTGTWETYTPGSTQLGGHFYSNKFDLRREVRTTAATHTVTKGQWGGTKDWFSFCAFFTTCASMVRYAYYFEETTTKRDSGGSWRDSVAIPHGDRSIIYTATQGIVREMADTESAGPLKSAGTTGYTRWGHIYEFVCHWHGGCCPVYQPGEVRKVKIQPPNPCVMGELAPMDESPSCVKEFGPPDFMYYQPCENDPGASGKPWVKEETPLSCIFSIAYNDQTIGDVSYSKTSPTENEVEWELKIWGDTHINGHTLLKGSVRGEDVSEWDSPMSPWWWRSSPVCDPPIFCKFDVGVNRWGQDVINYDDQVDPYSTLHKGAPENMYSSSMAVFVGYVSEEVIENG